ncbi:hypothetical protein GAYE_PCTG44G1077 [Galdieria yellowstonensis]|uniref:t-SNARE coiled-coil homology domain-containing protein n=1 Tax=Galdieria yellowstonensis TaxID=3028027 RepID=A0AAV9I739_9RHOD|nr:hypothetical protein GAYE_PCTG44G1077 [Galdieria yellowstonensis]
METQRRNRQLLFGKAENTRNNNSGSSDRNQAEQLFEQENNQAWEQLHGKVGSLKDIALQIGEEVNSQNQFLNNMRSSFDSVEELLSGTLHRLQRLVSERTGRHMCYLIVFIFIFFLFVYLFLRS